MAASNVTRFGDGSIAASGNAGAITVGSVSVGDLVIIGSNVLTSGVVSQPSAFSDSLGNTITPRLNITDATFGPYDVYEIIVTNAGTMTLTSTGAAGTTTVNIWGSQWTGTASWTYDANGATNNAYSTGGGNGQDQQTSDITFGAQSVAFALFGGVGIGANSPIATDAGWATYSKGVNAFGGSLIADQMMSGGTGHFHAQYTSFVYSGGAILSYSYTTGSSFDPATTVIGKQMPELPRPRIFAIPASFFAPPLPPDSRTVPWTGPAYPDAARRPRMRASEQAYLAQTFIDRTSPLLPNAVPDAVRRPTLHASEQQASALNPAPDARTVPWSAAMVPDAVRRPAMLAVEQLAATPRELVPERPFPYSDGIEPEAVRRPLEHARHQQPLADPTYGWALVAAAPNITPPAWPDSVRRPAMPVAEQRADAPRVPLDRPFPQVDGSAPDIVLRPRMLTGEQQALAAPPAFPDARTVQWSASTAPDIVRRPTLAAAQQQAWMDPTYAQLLVVVPAITPPAFPEAVRRPTFAAAQQRAFTVTTTTDAPYPQFYPAVAPERVYRPQFLAALQQALALQPRPERPEALASVSVPDRVERPTMRAALQQAHAEPQYTDRGVPWWCVVVPDRVLRATLPVAEQLAAVGMRVPDAPVPAPDLVALCYPASVSTVLGLTAARMAGAFMPPWRITNPIRPGGRGHGKAADVLLDRGAAAGGTLNTGTPSDSGGGHGDPADE